MLITVTWANKSENEPDGAPLSHRESALAQASCCDQDTDKRNELYLDERVELRCLL
jgi:hypothetical protein